MPLVGRLIFQLSRAHDAHADNNTYASFAFLYGCLPSAPTVFVYAYYANVAVKQVRPCVCNCHVYCLGVDVARCSTGDDIISAVAIHDGTHDKYGALVELANRFGSSHIAVEHRRCQ